MTHSVDYFDVQRRLQQLGLYAGTIDGIPGELTEAGIVQLSFSSFHLFKIGGDNLRSNMLEKEKKEE